MNKIYRLTIFFLFVAAFVHAQETRPAGSAVIEKALKEIKDFKTNERKNDSLTGHLLGSNKEEDFLRRYTFYRSLDEKLRRVNKTVLS